MLKPMSTILVVGLLAILVSFSVRFFLSNVENSRISSQFHVEMQAKTQLLQERLTAYQVLLSTLSSEKSVQKLAPYYPEVQLGYLGENVQGESATGALVLEQESGEALIVPVKALRDFILPQHNLNFQWQLIDAKNNHIVANYHTETDSFSVSDKENVAYVGEIVIQGKAQWVIKAQPSDRYYAQHHSIYPALLSLLTFVLTLLAALHQYFTQRKNHVLEETQHTLEAMTLTDSLTKVANRRAFDKFLEREWGRSLRDKTTLALIMIDVDDFKSFNDHYGHLAGDACLKQIAHTLSQRLRRQTDLLARYGGDEFVIVLPNTAHPELVAESCRREIAALAIPHQHAKNGAMVTITLGASCLVPESTHSSEALILQADEALYAAKLAGRNQVGFMPISED